MISFSRKNNGFHQQSSISRNSSTTPAACGCALVTTDFLGLSDISNLQTIAVRLRKKCGRCAAPFGSSITRLIQKWSSLMGLLPKVRSTDYICIFSGLISSFFKVHPRYFQSPDWKSISAGLQTSVDIVRRRHGYPN